MARGGLEAGRARFELVGIEAVDPAGAPRALFTDGATVTAPVAPSRPSESPLPESAVTLRFVTPLRIKVRHQLTDHPGFRDLAFHMLRRTLETHWHIPGAAMDWELQSLLRWGPRRRRRSPLARLGALEPAPECRHEARRSRGHPHPGRRPLAVRSSAPRRRNPPRCQRSRLAFGKAELEPISGPWLA